MSFFLCSPTTPLMLLTKQTWLISIIIRVHRFCYGESGVTAVVMILKSKILLFFMPCQVCAMYTHIFTLLFSPFFSRVLFRHGNLGLVMKDNQFLFFKKKGSSGKKQKTVCVFCSLHPISCKQC